MVFCVVGAAVLCLVNTPKLDGAKARKLGSYALLCMLAGIALSLQGGFISALDIAPIKRGGTMFSMLIKMVCWVGGMMALVPVAGIDLVVGKVESARAPRR